MKRYLFDAFLVLLAVAVLLALDAMYFRCSRWEYNENAVVLSLKQYYMAQEIYKENRYEEVDGAAYYSNTLAKLYAEPNVEGDGQRGDRLFSPNLANADSPERSLNGYFFLAPDEGDICVSGAGAGERPPDWLNEFELFALPVEYGVGGYHCFFINAKGKARKKKFDKTFRSWSELAGERPMEEGNGWSDA